MIGDPVGIEDLHDQENAPSALSSNHDKCLMRTLLFEIARCGANFVV